MQKNSVCRVAGRRRTFELRREKPARPQPNVRRPRQRAACCAPPRTSGQVERPESPRMRESIRLSPKRRGKACRNVARRRRACAARKRAASRKRTPARPFCGQSVRAGGGTASGRASGMFRPPCSLAQTTRGSRRARRAGQADEPRFCTVAQRLRGQKACPQAEHGSKKGKEQQKGLSSPGQSRKRKALFMFMGKR